MCDRVGLISWLVGTIRAYVGLSCSSIDTPTLNTQVHPCCRVRIAASRKPPASSPSSPDTVRRAKSSSREGMVGEGTRRGAAKWCFRCAWVQGGQCCSSVCVCAGERRGRKDVTVGFLSEGVIKKTAATSMHTQTRTHAHTTTDTLACRCSFHTWEDLCGEGGGDRGGDPVPVQQRGVQFGRGGGRVGAEHQLCGLV